MTDPSNRDSDDPTYCDLHGWYYGAGGCDKCTQMLADDAARWRCVAALAVGHAKQVVAERDEHARWRADLADKLYHVELERDEAHARIRHLEEAVREAAKKAWDSGYDARKTDCARGCRESSRELIDRIVAGEFRRCRAVDGSEQPEVMGDKDV